MTVRIQISPQDIISRFKEFPVPENAADFGPILAKTQNKPQKYDDFKKAGPLILPGEHNKKAHQNKSKDQAHKQDQIIQQPNPQANATNSVESIINIPEQHKEITFGNMVQPNPVENQQTVQNNQTQQVSAQPNAEQQNNSTENQSQPANFGFGFIPQQQFGFNQQPQFGFNPQQQFGFTPQPQFGFNPQQQFGFNPQPSFELQSPFVQQQPESIEPLPEVIPQQVVEESKPPGFDQIESEERKIAEEQAKPVVEEEKKPAEEVSYQPQPYNPPVDFSQLESEQKRISESQKQKKSEKVDNSPIKYSISQSSTPAVSINQVIEEQKKEEKTKEKQEKQPVKQEKPLAYKQVEQNLPNDFLSIEEEQQYKQALEASIREQKMTNKKPEPVIKYGTAPKASNAPSLEDIIKQQEKLAPKAEPKETIKAGKHAKYTQYVPPKKEPLPPPVKPNVPSFESLLSEAKGDNKPLNVVERKDTQPSKKKNKYQPFVAEQPAKPTVAPVVSPNVNFSSLLDSEEKKSSKPAAPAKAAPQPQPQQTTTTTGGKKKKSKYVEYVPPEQAKFSNAPAAKPTTTAGPSFEDLMAEESKKTGSGAAAPSTSSKKKGGKKIVISENTGAYAAPKKYDPYADDEYVAARKAAVNAPPKNEFAKLLEEESRKQQPKQANTRLGYSAARTTAAAASFEQLMAEEQKKQEAIENAAFSYLDNQVRSTFEDEEKKAIKESRKEAKNKKNKRNIGANDFWNFDDIKDDDEIIQEVKPMPTKSQEAMQRISKHNTSVPKAKPEDWMKEKLVKNGIDDFEAGEFSEIIITKNRVDMTDTLKSLDIPVSTVTQIVSDFFRLYPGQK